MALSMTRKTFIQSLGATCKNWQWSWSFINETERFVIFGAWDVNTQGQKTLIFSEDWRLNANGNQNIGYAQSREHIRLIEDESFKLMTFPMKYSDAKKKQDGSGPAKIDGFTPTLSERFLKKIGKSWYADDNSECNLLAEEISSSEKYEEGAKIKVTINAFERNAQARRVCIAHHGPVCAVCNFDFQRNYGVLGSGFIHVHHIVPISTIGKNYKIDPVNDLIPVCPNCHAMIHQVTPPLQINQLKEIIKDLK